MRISEQIVRKYAKLYRTALKKQGISITGEKTRSYSARLREMYASDQCRVHNVYPTVNTPLVYAVIAMCLELRGDGFSNDKIMGFMNTAFRGKRKFFDTLIRVINCLPNSFEIARKWNINDHAKREEDHSITYDYFHVSDDAVEYRISRCMYVEMFETYGIRELCRIFCETDTRSYAGLRRQVVFVRHSELSNGDACMDEIYRRR